MQGLMIVTGDATLRAAFEAWLGRICETVAANNDRRLPVLFAKCSRACDVEASCDVGEVVMVRTRLDDVALAAELCRCAKEHRSLIIASCDATPSPAVCELADVVLAFRNGVLQVEKDRHGVLPFTDVRVYFGVPA